MSAVRHFLFSPFLQPPGLSSLPPCPTYTLQPFRLLPLFPPPTLPRTGQSPRGSCPHLLLGPLLSIMCLKVSGTQHRTYYLTHILPEIQEDTEASSCPRHAIPLGLQHTIAATTRSYLVG